MARFRAYTLAQAESMPSRKLGQIRMAVRLLEDAQVRLKDEVTLPLLRAMILTARWDAAGESGEQDDRSYERLYKSWEKFRGRTPYSEAVDAMEDALALAPNARVVRRLLAEVLRYRAMELALGGIKHDEAHRLLRRAVAIDAGTPGAGATLGARLIVAWEAVLDGLARSEADACGQGLDRLRLTLASLDRPGTDGDVTEEMLTIAILAPCLELGRGAVTRGQPGDALSLIVAIHNIQTAIEERLAARGGSGNRQKIREDLRSLAAGLLERAPQFSDRIPPSLR
ncbi:MAG: hypothetical protein HRU14_16030 [Planctomycetes bacterium]|nr:hypothetical protein [Planctomycetota bacterium]